MIELEARALETLDKITLAWLDLVLSESSQSDTIPDNPIALMLDVEFS